jgi:hypothetical protein
LGHMLATIGQKEARHGVVFFKRLKGALAIGQETVFDTVHRNSV